MNELTTAEKAIAMNSLDRLVIDINPIDSMFYVRQKFLWVLEDDAPVKIVSTGSTPNDAIEAHWNDMASGIDLYTNGGVYRWNGTEFEEVKS